MAGRQAGDFGIGIGLTEKGDGVAIILNFVTFGQRHSVLGRAKNIVAPTLSKIACVD